MAHMDPLPFDSVPGVIQERFTHYVYCGPYTFRAMYLEADLETFWDRARFRR